MTSSFPHMRASASTLRKLYWARSGCRRNCSEPHARTLHKGGGPLRLAWRTLFPGSGWKGFFACPTLQAERFAFRGKLTLAACTMIVIDRKDGSMRLKNGQEVQSLKFLKEALHPSFRRSFVGISSSRLVGCSLSVPRNRVLIFAVSTWICSSLSSLAKQVTYAGWPSWFLFLALSSSSFEESSAPQWLPQALFLHLGNRKLAPCAIRTTATGPPHPQSKTSGNGSSTPEHLLLAHLASLIVSRDDRRPSSRSPSPTSFHTIPDHPPLARLQRTNRPEPIPFRDTVGQQSQSAAAVLSSPRPPQPPPHRTRLQRSEPLPPAAPPAPAIAPQRPTGDRSRITSVNLQHLASSGAPYSPMRRAANFHPTDEVLAMGYKVLRRDMGAHLARLEDKINGV